jgi:hypothetical protein
MKKLILLFIATTNFCFAQNTWTTLTMPAGSLTYGVSYCVQFDDLGNTYVGTDDGLKIYNGSTWTQIGYPDSINTCCAQGIAIDSNQTVWVATNAGVWIRPYGGAWQQITSPLTYLKGVQVDHNNNIWFYEGNMGSDKVLKYDGTNWTTFVAGTYGGNLISDLKIDINNNVWVLHNYGLSKFDGSAWTYYDDTDWNMAGYSRVTAFDVDISGNAWLGITDDSNIEYYLTQFDGTTWTNHHIPYQIGANFYTDMSVVIADNYGNKWLGAPWNNVVIKYDGTKFTPITGIGAIGPTNFNNATGTLWVEQDNPSDYNIYLYRESGFNTIEGKVYNDLNGDGLVQSNEPNIADMEIHLMPDNKYLFTDSTGYSFGLFDSIGSYTVSLNTPPFWQISTVPSTYSLTQTFQTEISDSIDFGLVPLASINEADVDLTLSMARPGFVSCGWISYTNNGTNQLSDSLILQLDTAFTFLSSIPPPDNISSNFVSWNYINLNPFEKRNITYFATLSTSSNPGDIVSNSAIIFPVTGDSIQVNNFDTVFKTVTSSLDPNLKEVEPQGTGVNGSILPNQQLTYTIYFQNTGTDTTFNIIINDTLPVNADISTLKVIGTSHPSTYQLYYKSNKKILKFTFTNILLPDSNTNEPLSHGYVKFSILPKTSLPDGSVLSNRAFIYFDFNTPVQTNTVVNTIDHNLSIEEFPSNYEINILQNPSSGNFTIVFQNMIKTGVIKIYNAVGINIFEEPVFGEFKKDIKLKNISSGIYFVKVFDGEESYCKKLIIEDN